MQHHLVTWAYSEQASSIKAACVMIWSSISWHNILMLNAIFF